MSRAVPRRSSRDSNQLSYPERASASPSQRRFRLVRESLPHGRESCRDNRCCWIHLWTLSQVVEPRYSSVRRLAVRAGTFLSLLIANTPGQRQSRRHVVDASRISRSGPKDTLMAITVREASRSSTVASTVVFTFTALSFAASSRVAVVLT